MKNNKTDLLEFISKTGIFKTPFVQRDYEWFKEDILELLEDIFDIDLNDEVFCKHELQDMLYESQFHHELGKKGITIYILWDGLQRFVTVYLTIVVVVELLKEKGDADWEMLLNEYLINPKEEEKYFYKLQFTSEIKNPICDILNRIIYGISFDELKYKENLVFKAYSFIKQELSDKTIDELNLFYKKLHGLKVLFKEGENTDHMPTQFKLTNKRGKPISNYTYLKACLLGNKSEEDLSPQHKKCFKNMEQTLIDRTASNPHVALERFFKFYLKFKDVPKKMGRKNWVKQFEKEIKSTPDTNKLIEDIYVHFEYFNIIYNGTSTSDKLTNKIKEFRSLGTQSIDYFLFGCAKDFKLGKLGTDDFIEIIDICENYLLRMHCLNNKQSGASFINKLHNHGNPHNTIDKTDYLNSFKRILINPESRGNVKFPNNVEFRNKFISMNWNTSSLSSAFTKFVEISIQNHVADKKHQNKIQWGKTKHDKFKHSFDHIHAQNPKGKSKEMRIMELDGGLTEFEYIHDRLLNNIGNLVPTLYNSEMSNKPFSEKCSQKEGYLSDDLVVTEKLLSYDKWGKEEIIDFANWKFEIILDRFPFISVDNTLKNYKSRVMMESK